MAYKGFDAKGFRLTAIFDADSAKVGTKVGDAHGGSPSNPSASCAPPSRKNPFAWRWSQCRRTCAGRVDQLVAAGIRGISTSPPSPSTSHPTWRSMRWTCQFNWSSSHSSECFRLNPQPTPGRAYSRRPGFV